TAGSPGCCRFPTYWRQSCRIPTWKCTSCAIMPSRGAVCESGGFAGAARPLHARGDRRQHLQTLAEPAHGPPQPFARLGGAGRTDEGSTIFTVNAGGSLAKQSRRRKIVSSLSIFVDRMLMAPTDGAFACAAPPPASLHPGAAAFAA